VTEGEIKSDGHERSEKAREKTAEERGSEKLQKETDLLFTPEEVQEIVEASRPSSSNEEDGANAGPGENFVVPTRLAAFGAAFFALACLVALVIVASTESADALATIALALAVLAFVVQIVVFIYQSIGSNQQILQSEQIYTETRTLLTEVKTAAKSTEDLVREQFRDVLKAFLEAQPSTKQEANFLAALRSELATSRSGPSPSEPRPIAVTERPKARARQRRASKKQFFTFPSEKEGGAVIEKLKNLDQRALGRIRLLAEDQRLLTELSSLDQLGEPVEPEDKLLEEQGLTRTARISVGSETFTVSQLTDEGLVAANILLATGEIPEYAQGFLEAFNPDEDDPES
jgi:heme/copper-type cytochrome/quinol oxidase subunit 4